MQILTAEQKEKLSNEILVLLREYRLDSDVNIYYNDRCLKGNGLIENNKCASDYFRYATDNTISMSFEGDLYEVLNYRQETVSNEFIPKFMKLLESYGLSYELGDKWNLGTFFVDDDGSDEVVEEEGASPNSPIYINQASCPPALEPIRAEWERHQNEHGDEGSAVICAGFTFKFNGLFYRMPPQGMWQGSISWEASAPYIKTLLTDIGCEDTVYHDGVMD